MGLGNVLFLNMFKESQDKFLLREIYEKIDLEIFKAEQIVRSNDPKFFL